MTDMRIWIGKHFRRRLQSPAAPRSFSTMRISHIAAETEGSQLLEFAMVLPFLLVFLVGIIQFAGAFNLKQKEANAAREGARVMVSNILADSSCSTSFCSVEAAASAMANYMTNAGVDTSCINPASPSISGPPTWTYSCKGITLSINNQYVYTPTGGSPVTGTQVTVKYPYSWSFNNVIKLLLPNANIGLPTTLTETAVMQNISN